MVAALGVSASAAMVWDQGDKHPRAFTYAAVPYETWQMNDAGAAVRIAGEGKALFEADQVSVMVSGDHAAYFRMRMRQYRFTIEQELHKPPVPASWRDDPRFKMNPGAWDPPELIEADWFSAWVRVPAGSSPDAAALIAGIAGVREAQPSPVLTTDVVGAGPGGAAAVLGRR